jgi:nucleotide-binding universal stress UspA family protein
MALDPASAHQLEVGKAGRHGGPSLVLVGYDRTDAGKHALSYAAGLAERTGARLVVLTVNESLALDCATGARACVEDIASEVQQVVPGCGDGCEVAVEVGDPAGAIQRVAGDLQADLIVVGQSRHRWTRPFGSVPARLAHHADHPVLIVP